MDLAHYKANAITSNKFFLLGKKKQERSYCFENRWYLIKKSRIPPELDILQNEGNRIYVSFSIDIRYKKSASSE